MIDFIKELRKEREELWNKLDKLLNFLESDEFETIDAFQSNMIAVQIRSMQAYHACLTATLNYLRKTRVDE